MTAIANVGMTGESTPLFSVATIKEGPGSTGFMPDGIFCISALVAPDGQFLYLSLIGRDTAFQELRGKMTAGQINSFLIERDGKQMASGWFSRDWLGKMEYHGAKLQTALFGEVGQMILYHPLLTTPDKATQTAALPFLGKADSQTVNQVWQLVKHICEVPLLDAWQAVVMPLLASLEWLKPLQGFGCNASYVKLGSNIAGLISANIRSGAVCIEADAEGRYAFPDRMTTDLEYGLANRHQQQAPQDHPAKAGSGWDGWETISVHTRQRLIEDGDLVDVSDTSEAREAGFRVPVALTRSVWNRYAEWDNGEVSTVQRRLGQSTKGRLWDLLYMACHAIRASSKGGDVLHYGVCVIPKDGRSTSPRDISLKLHSGPGDQGEHVITIMLPEED